VDCFVLFPVADFCDDDGELSGSIARENFLNM
jgi:hypothetical protein